MYTIVLQELYARYSYQIIGVNQELVSLVYIDSSTNQFWHNCTLRCYTALKKNYCNMPQVLLLLFLLEDKNFIYCSWGSPHEQ